MFTREPGYQEATSFPRMVVVSITTACDFACRHCFHRRYVRSAVYRRQDMEPPLFEAIVGEMADHQGSILRLIGWGEPLCHALLVEFIGHASVQAPDCPVTLITNGYHMPPARSLAMMKAGLDLIEISIDAAKPETYRRLRRSPFSDAFDAVEMNTREMVRQRDTFALKTRIAVSFVEFPTTESHAEFLEFEARWRGSADEVIRRPAHTFKGSVGLPERTDPRLPCYGLWARCNINCWGQVSVCYNDWENRHVLGDLRKPGTKIGDIWRGRALAGWRAAQCQGRFQGICKACRDYNPGAWQLPYEKVVERCTCSASTASVT